MTEEPVPEAVRDEVLIESLSHTRFVDCYQCGKCTAGCPMSKQMDMMPNQMVRMLQIGETGRALSAAAIWQCVSCQTCSTRCPKSVDCAAIMDALRQVSLIRRSTSPAQLRTILFQQAFLQNIRRNGRLRELELIAQFKGTAFLRDGRLALLFQDASLAPALARRKKLHVWGERARDRGVVGRIFARCQEQSPA